MMIATTKFNDGELDGIPPGNGQDEKTKILA